MMCLFNLKVFCFVLLISAPSFAGNQINKKANLQNGGVNADSIVSDLQAGKRAVLTMGYVTEEQPPLKKDHPKEKTLGFGYRPQQLTLFVSDPLGISSAYRMDVSFQSSNGSLSISNTPVFVSLHHQPAPDVLFYCAGTESAQPRELFHYLVQMSSTTLDFLDLESRRYNETKGNDTGSCFQQNSHYISNGEPFNYYVLDSSGHLSRYHFESYGKSLFKFEGNCSLAEDVGYLCSNGKNISIMRKCDGTSSSSPPLTSIVSGLIDNSVAILFDNSGTVYSFDWNKAVKGSSTKLTKLTRKSAYVRGKDYDDYYPYPRRKVRLLWVIIGVLILTCILLSLALWFYWVPLKKRCKACKDKKKKKMESQKDGRMRSGKVDSGRKWSSQAKRRSSKQTGGGISSKKSSKSPASRSKNRSKLKKRSSSKLPGKSGFTSGKTSATGGPARRRS